MTNRLISFFLIFTFSLPALAHPGHGESGLMYGLLHPLTGIDHLLVMVTVGVLGGRFGGRLRWQLPTMFVCMMSVGIFLGIFGLTVSWLETSIAISVMVMGLLLIAKKTTSSIPLMLISIIAILHGMAHGVEATSAAGVETVLAMLLSTAGLHLVGLLMALQLRGRENAAYSWAGTTMVVTGLGMLAS